MEISVSKLSKKRLGDWVVNPYVGCEHGCKHCYCPAMPGVMFFNEGHTQQEWGEYLFPKKDWIERLTKEVRKFPREGSKAGKGYIRCSFLTDCYTPAEAKYMLTRQTLEILLEKGCKVRVQTRSALVERDFDLLVKHKSQVLLGTSLPYLDDRLSRILEPKATAPSRRLEMLRKAKAAGLDVYVAVAPFMPLHGVSELTEVINAVKELKPVEIFCEVLNPRAENLAMMNDALATAGRPERIDAEYQERWARYTHSMLTTVAAECERAGVGDSLIAWPDLKAAKSKKLTETERAWLQRWIPTKEEMKVPKTAHQMELDGRKAQKEVKVKFDIESAVQEVITLLSGIVKMSVDALEPALKIGEKLSGIKRAIKQDPSNSWMDWCEENLKMAHRTLSA